MNEFSQNKRKRAKNNKRSMPETTDEHKKKKPRQLFSQPELERLEAEYAQLSPGHGYAALAKELAKELSLDPVRITYAPSTHCATGEVLTCPNLCARCLDHDRYWFKNKRKSAKNNTTTDGLWRRSSRRCSLSPLHLTRLPLLGPLPDLPGLVLSTLIGLGRALAALPGLVLSTLLEPARIIQQLRRRHLPLQPAWI